MILSGNLINLRPVTIHDARLFFEWLSQEHINKNVLRKAVTLEDVELWVQNIFEKKNEIHFTLETKQGSTVGIISLKIESTDFRGEIALLIGGTENLRRGYGYESSNMIMNYAFNKLFLHRIWLSVYEYNKQASALYEKLGFKKEGVLREHVFYQGKYYNEIIMGILKKEWEMKNG